MSVTTSFAGRFASRVRARRFSRLRVATVALALILVVALSGWALLVSSLFGVRSVTVTGTERLSRQEVVQAAAIAAWSDDQQWGRDRLTAIERRLRTQRVAFGRGGEYDRWDLEVRGGLIGAARMSLVVEAHEGGVQAVRARSWPR